MEQPKPKYNQQNKTKVVSLEKGKMPPQATDLEETILSTAINIRYGVSELIEIFREEKVFYNQANQLIYDSMLEMFQNEEPIDLLTISNHLRNKGKLEIVGGDYYLIGITNKGFSSDHLEFHARIVLQMHVKRKSIEIASKIVELAYDQEKDIFELLTEAQTKIDDIGQWLIRKKPKEFKSIVDSFFDRSKNNIAGIPNSLRNLQLKLNGWRNQDLVIIAARPGMGKTALILNEAYYQAKLGIRVGIFSLEMSANDLVGRMISNECEINYSLIHNNKTNDFQKRLMDGKRADFSKLPLYIHDQASLTPMELKVQAGKWKRENKIQIIYVDYLQLMEASGKNNSGNREQEISSISRSLKGTAKDLDIPVIALSQLSRACESRGGMKRPILSDLRESGAIEQDADIVIFPYRPEYYKIEVWDDDDHTSTIGQCEINIAKFRGGEPGATVVGVKLQYMRFNDLEDQDNFFDSLPKPPLGNSNDAFDAPENIDPPVEDDVPF